MATIAILPFKYISDMVTVELLVLFSEKSGISQVSPREIICRHRLDTAKHCKMPSVSYCELHDEWNVRNSIQTRTNGVISMTLMGNMQVFYESFCFETRKKLIRWSRNAIVSINEKKVKNVERKKLDSKGIKILKSPQA